MPSNHLILCHPLLLPSIFPSIRVFSKESALYIRWPKYWSFSFSINLFNEYSGLIFLTRGLSQGHKQGSELESLLSVIEKRCPSDLILIYISWYNVHVCPETPFNMEVGTAWNPAGFQVQENGSKGAEPKRLPGNVSWLVILRQQSSSPLLGLWTPLLPLLHPLTPLTTSQPHFCGNRCLLCLLVICLGGSLSVTQLPREQPHQIPAIAIRRASQGAGVVKNLPTAAGDARDEGSIPGSGGAPGTGKGNLLQHSCLENSMVRGAWRGTVHRDTASRTQLSKQQHCHKAIEARIRKMFIFI